MLNATGYSKIVDGHTSYFLLPWANCKISGHWKKSNDFRKKKERENSVYSGHSIPLQKPMYSAPTNS